MAHYRASESKREQFRRYLDESGVIDSITNVLVALYEETDKPNNALEFIKLHLGVAGPEPAAAEALRMELADLQQKCNLLMEQNKELRNRVGGFDGNTLLFSTEAYNPRTNTWHAVSSMLTPRSNFGIEVIDDQLFAVRGFNGFTTSFNVEHYDATTDKWSETCTMEISRSGLSCCVVSKIPNMAKYAVPRDSLTFIHLEESSVESEDSV